MTEPLSDDDDDDALSDEDVYALLHEAWLLFQNKTAATPLGRDVITVLSRQIEHMQRGMIGVMDGVTFPEPDEPPPGS